MTATTNAENSRQYKVRFSSIVEQILAFVWHRNMVTEVKNLSVSTFQINCATVFYVIEYSHLDS